MNGCLCRNQPPYRLFGRRPRKGSSLLIRQPGGGHWPLADIYFFLSVTAWAFFCLAVTIVFNLLTDVLFGWDVRPLKA